MHSYPLTEAQRRAFAEDGWVHLPAFLSEAELRPLEALYWRFLQREIAVPGRDYCDATTGHGRSIEGPKVVIVHLPRRCHAPMQGNIYEQRASVVARQLCGEGMEIDYDQFVAKPPRERDAVIHWHQDLRGWPATPDPRTATFWLAFDDTDYDNGCVQFVDGSHREVELRPHVPLAGGPGPGPLMVAEVDPRRDRIRPARLHRGDATVYHERTLHGSSGNGSARWRRAYVVAFRSADTVQRERAMGFTHSLNDPPEVLARVVAERREE
ncbi:MAG: phytanoyl-CoA dioxygenase family protein [Planctomycetes bacterium]|nr:phytanoyl-CoA dioxygenase family protein [Planctomycetota bacterium]